MRYEARRRRGGRCRVRAHYIGKYEQTRNPRERKRAMRKRIETPSTSPTCSFSSQVYAKNQDFGQSFVAFVRNSLKTFALTDPRNSVG